MSLGSRARALPAIAAIGVAAIVTINAWSGLMPGVGFWDTGEFQTVLPIMGTAHPTGYPTYILLGFVANLLLTPLGEPAFRINVLSLLAIAAAAGLTVELVRRLTDSLPIGIAAGLGLATTPVVWSNATRADPHPIHLLFVALLLVLLVGWEAARRAGHPGADRWLVGAAATFGLAAGNHSLTLLLAPPIGLYVLAVHPGIVRRPRLLLACGAALAIALVAVYLELPLRAGLLRAPLVYARPDTWDGFWYIALAEQFRGSLSDPLGDLFGKAADLWTFTTAQLGPLAILVPLGFLATLRRAPRYALLTGTAMLITVVFNASYSNADINRYYLGPVLWAWTWVAMLAAVAVDLAVWLWAPIARRPSDRVRLATTAVAVVVAVALLVPQVGQLGGRRLQADRSGDTGAQAWLDAVLPAIAPDAVLISWWSTSTPLWYAELVEGRRTDIDVVDDRTILDRDYGTAVGAIDTFFGARPVYVIRANNGDLAGVMAAYRLQIVAASGSLAVYRVVGPVDGAG
ncbi:MAG TPA: DUF2723 domain-containing protein [Candidatus Acidoferrales bacterium]|nr:DUF2723 domain-containing protein [Candidatus Acidoferrales bacterium]